MRVLMEGDIRSIPLFSFKKSGIQEILVIPSQGKAEIAYHPFHATLRYMRMPKK